MLPHPYARTTCFTFVVSLCRSTTHLLFINDSIRSLCRTRSSHFSLFLPLSELGGFVLLKIYLRWCHIVQSTLVPISDLQHRFLPERAKARVEQSNLPMAPAIGGRVHTKCSQLGCYTGKFKQACNYTEGTRLPQRCVLFSAPDLSLQATPSHLLALVSRPGSAAELD